MKITATMRRMINDTEFYEAVCALVHATENVAIAKEKIARIERKNRERNADRRANITAMNHQAGGDRR